jgi:hypothetical protein
MKSEHHIKCLCCNELHAVDRRNAGRQKYCGKPLCRKASKAASQRLWNAKEGNKDYFKRDKNSARARAWQTANPGYWRDRKPRKAEKSRVLQETYVSQAVDTQLVETSLVRLVLQDFCPAQVPLFVGIISSMSGYVLQEDLADVIRKLCSRGADILRMSPSGPEHTKSHRTQCVCPGALP